MSTLPRLLQYEDEQPPKLVRFVPRLIGREREQRMITMLPDLHDWLTKPAKQAALQRTKAEARAHFGEFVKGAHVDDCRFMKRVEDRRMTPPDFSHEVWSVSPRFSEPQYRFFGTFVTRDWLLVVSKQERAALDGHQNRWHQEISKVLRIWKSLFGNDLPHSGPQLRDYISMNAEHCDDRW
jgi:hypothetical protein